MKPINVLLIFLVIIFCCSFYFLNGKGWYDFVHEKTGILLVWIISGFSFFITLGFKGFKG